jgi:hypothetical protein
LSVFQKLYSLYKITLLSTSKANPSINQPFFNRILSTNNALHRQTSANFVFINFRVYLDMFGKSQHAGELTRFNSGGCHLRTLSSSMSARKATTESVRLGGH